jgi:hypothetical protein
MLFSSLHVAPKINACLSVCQHDSTAHILIQYGTADHDDTAIATTIRSGMISSSSWDLIVAILWYNGVVCYPVPQRAFI